MLHCPSSTPPYVEALLNLCDHEHLPKVELQLLCREKLREPPGDQGQDTHTNDADMLMGGRPDSSL